MRAATKLLIAGLLALGASAPVSAQTDLLGEGSQEATVRQDSWDYQRSVGLPTPQQMVHEKAHMRAVQRMNRMAALEWYGYSKARPRTSATPFTGMYGGQWQANLHTRPNAWHTGYQRTWIVVR